MRPKTLTSATGTEDRTPTGVAQTLTRSSTQVHEETRTPPFWCKPMPMNKSEAQTAYRRAWENRCLARTAADQIAAEQAMDAVQPYCVDNGRPGPEWDAFRATLPGYNDHWARLASAIEKPIKRP